MFFVGLILGASLLTAVAQIAPEFQNGVSTRPSVAGSDRSSGLYFGTAFTGVTKHLATSNLSLPVVSTCGTSPALATGSSDTAFKITVGTSASNACTLTFGTAYTTAPVCVVQNLTTGAAANVYAVSTTAIVWSSALADSTVLHGLCIGLSGG